MQIKTLPVGELQTNCYIISKDNEALVIDPGAEIDRILRELKDLKVKYIVLTHGHYDHVTEAFSLKEKVKAPVIVHEKDEVMMIMTTQQKADLTVKSGDKLDLKGLTLTVLHTPGHSAGSMCLYSEKEKMLFSGDTLFAGCYGRTDLPLGSQTEMENSLKRILALPGDIKVFPGHGPATTIAQEKTLL